jgi:FKBP-type peptidyl-prolyl cis-trans isomerase
MEIKKIRPEYIVGFLFTLLAGTGILMISFYDVMGSQKSYNKTGLQIETLLKIDKQNCIACENNDLLKMEYTGNLVDGTQFDTSKGNEPFEFTLGNEEVIKGWDLGIPGMCLNEIRRLTIPSEYGYGIAGVLGVIPPNSTLIFNIQLLSINGIPEHFVNKKYEK